MVWSAFAVTAPGLEPLAAAELNALGVAPTTPELGGVAFDAEAETIATVNLHLRTVTRVLVRAASFHAANFRQLERGAREIEWESWISSRRRVGIRVTCRKSRLFHSDAVAERICTAIAARVPGAVFDEQAEDDTPKGVQLIVVRLHRDECVVSIDTSGEALHRRGYRQALAKAPLRETLAAAMLMGAGWVGDTALRDPLCGSGTIAIEAALLASRVAPGIGRSFAAEEWPTAASAVWSAARERARALQRRAPSGLIVGSDRDEGAIAAARSNAERAGVCDVVTWSTAALSSAKAHAAQGLLIANPPFGVRVSSDRDLRDFYATIGRVARSGFPGWQLALLSAETGASRPLERQVALNLAPVWVTTHGGLRVRLITGDIPA